MLLSVSRIYYACSCEKRWMFIYGMDSSAWSPYIKSIYYPYKILFNSSYNSCHAWIFYFVFLSCEFYNLLLASLFPNSAYPLPPMTYVDCFISILITSGLLFCPSRSPISAISSILEPVLSVEFCSFSSSCPIAFICEIVVAAFVDLSSLGRVALSLLTTDAEISALICALFWLFLYESYRVLDISC